MSQILPQEDFFQLLSRGKLVSVDLLVRNEHNQILVGYRTNKPAQHTWFVPGGVVQKNERLPEALDRVALQELGVRPTEISFTAVAQHHYPDNFRGVDDIGTNYLVIAFECRIHSAELITDSQHEKALWLSPHELLTHPDVHPYTRAYFDPTPPSEVIVFMK